MRALGLALAARAASWITPSLSGVTVAWSLPKNSMKLRAGCGVSGDDAATTACVRSPHAASSSAAQAVASKGLYMDTSFRGGRTTPCPGQWFLAAYALSAD